MKNDWEKFLGPRWSWAVIVVLIQLAGGAGLISIAGYVRREFGRVLIGSTFVLDSFLAGLGIGLIITGLLCAGGFSYLALIYARTIRIATGVDPVLLVMRRSRDAIPQSGDGLIANQARVALPNYMTARFAATEFELWDGGQRPLCAIPWGEVESFEIVETRGLPRKLSFSLTLASTGEVFAVTPLSTRNQAMFETDRERMGYVLDVARHHIRSADRTDDHSS